MTKKKGPVRASHEGTIYKSKTRGCWVAEITLGYNPKTGRRVKRMKTAPTQREAKERLSELRMKYASITRLEAEHLTTGEWLEKWFTTYIEPKIREDTQVSYLSSIAIIKEELGHIRLDRLNAMDIQKVIYGRLKNKYRSAQLFRLLIKRALKKAVQLHILAENPAADLELPEKPGKRPFVRPTREDWQKLMEAKAPCRGWKYLMLTEYVTGARISELTALKWEDVTLCYSQGSKAVWLNLGESAPKNNLGPLSGGALHIGHAMVSGRNKEKGAPRNLLRCSTKTAEGDRHLPLPPDYCRELLEHRKNQLEYKLSLGDAYKDQGYIFTKWDGSPQSPRSLSSYYSKLRKELGIGTTLHMLRHDMASRMKASRLFDLKDVQTQLGHSTIQITMDLYTHIGDEEKENVKTWLQNGMQGLLKASAPVIPKENLNQ